VAEQSAFLVEIENEFRIENITSYNGCFGITASPMIRARAPAGPASPGPLPVRNAPRRWPPQEWLAERGAPIDDGAIARGIANRMAGGWSASPAA